MRTLSLFALMNLHICIRKYLIHHKEVKCNLTNGGMACGPVFGNVVVSIQYEHDGVVKWFHAVEVEGFLNAFVRHDDIFDVLLKDDYDADYVDYLEETSEKEVAGIELTGEYDDITAALILPVRQITPSV